MMFEDFNYNQFNRFILVDPENPQSKEESMLFANITQEEKEVKELTDGVLKNAIKDEYKQELITIEDEKV